MGAMGLFGRKKAKESPEAIRRRIELEKDDIELAKKLEAQDRQHKAILEAERVYEETGDIGGLIDFWEDIWGFGGLLFNGSKWTFRLPDLYIQIQEYDNALRILRMIKNPAYQEKRNSYIERVYELKAKKGKG